MLSNPIGHIQLIKVFETPVVVTLRSRYYKKFGIEGNDIQHIDTGIFNPYND